MISTNPGHTSSMEACSAEKSSTIKDELLRLSYGNQKQFVLVAHNRRSDEVSEITIARSTHLPTRSGRAPAKESQFRGIPLGTPSVPL